MVGRLALKVCIYPCHVYTANAYPDISTREQAFMTGFAHQIFRLQELPGELASWMIDQSKAYPYMERCNC
jgi:hypothetical protein